LILKGKVVCRIFGVCIQAADSIAQNPADKFRDPGSALELFINPKQLSFK